MRATNHYATDGLCHNSEPGTHGQECGKPATWLGARVGLIRGAQPFVMGFCDACKEHGAEAAGMARWERIPERETPSCP